MNAIVTDVERLPRPPDHTQLPESDGTFVKNFDELPQSILLTDALGPVLQRRHPDGQYCIGQDSGIYWNWTDPPLEGVKAPDWFYVPGVGPTVNGERRRSYVLWWELIAPLIILEFVSGSGEEEHDRTPRVGKFWVYEQAIRAPYYGIFDAAGPTLEVYRLMDARYQRMQPNEQGRYLIAPLEVELGIWRGAYQNREAHWLRWWDTAGNLLPTGTERAEQEHRAREEAQAQAEQERRAREEAQAQAEQERRAREEAQAQAEQERRAREEAQAQAEQERRAREEAQAQAARLAERLRALGIDPEAL